MDTYQLKDLADFGVSEVASSSLTFDERGNVFLDPEGALLELPSLMTGRQRITTFSNFETGKFHLVFSDLTVLPKTRRPAKQGHLPVWFMRITSGEAPTLFRIKDTTLCTRIGRLNKTYPGLRWWMQAKEFTWQGDIYTSPEVNADTEVQSAPAEGFVEVRVKPGVDFSMCSLTGPVDSPYQVKTSPNAIWSLLQV